MLVHTSARICKLARKVGLIVDMDGFHINCNHSEKDLSALVDSAGKTSA